MSMDVVVYIVFLMLMFVLFVFLWLGGGRLVVFWFFRGGSNLSSI